MLFSSIWTIDRTLSGVTTPGQSGPGSDGNEVALCFPQSSNITGTSPSDCLVSLQDTRCGEGVVPLCRDAVGVFYSPRRLGKKVILTQYIYIYIYWIRIFRNRNTSTKIIVNNDLVIWYILLYKIHILNISWSYFSETCQICYTSINVYIYVCMYMCVSARARFKVDMTYEIK